MHPNFELMNGNADDGEAVSRVIIDRISLIGLPAIETALPLIGHESTQLRAGTKSGAYNNYMSRTTIYCDLQPGRVNKAEYSRRVGLGFVCAPLPCGAGDTPRIGAHPTRSILPGRSEDVLIVACNHWRV